MQVEGLTFDADSHTYWYRGQRVPNVTSILEILDETWRVDPDILEAAAARGTAVHLATELDDKGDLDERSLDERLQPYLEAWRTFRREMGFAPSELESRVWHPRFRYAGTLDRIGTFSRWPSKVELIDIKSGEAWPSHGPQTAAYQDAYQTLTRTRVHRRWCVYLADDGRYRLVEKAEADGFAVFLACLQITRFRERSAA